MTNIIVLESARKNSRPDMRALVEDLEDAAEALNTATSDQDRAAAMLQCAEVIDQACKMAARDLEELHAKANMLAVVNQDIGFAYLPLMRSLLSSMSADVAELERSEKH